MNSKYSPLDHGGLESVNRADGIELASASSPPVDRKSTMFNAEPSPPPPHTKEEHGNYYGGETPSSFPQTPYSDLAKPAYFNSDSAETGHQPQQPHNGRSGRTYCGMRKAIFIALVAAVVLLVCVGAVLGGVLGTMLPKKDAGNSAQSLVDSDDDGPTGEPLKTRSSTGLASTISADGSGRLITYYQDPDGRIIENSYLDNRWTLDDPAMISGSVVTVAADAGSPLAAVSYEADGKVFRQVFFVGSGGEIMTTYSSTTSANVAQLWSEPELIVEGDTAAPGSIGLDACTGTGLGSIRVFYPSEEGYIQEIVYSFDTGDWIQGVSFDQSDTGSGVACTVSNWDEDKYINLYVRNTATKRVQQHYNSFGDGSDDWSDSGPKAWLNQTIAQGSDIAVCGDGQATEYVFYQLEGGMMTKGVLYSDEGSFSIFRTMQGATVGSKFAVAYLADGPNSGPALTFQNDSSDSTMWLSQYSRNDAQLLDLAIG